MNQQWEERQRPARLEGRFEFKNYRALRDFLDSAAELSEREGFYPDIGFRHDYVNITIHAKNPDSELGEVQHHFARQLDELAIKETH